MLRLRFCHESSWAFNVPTIVYPSTFRESSRIIFDCSLSKSYGGNHYNISKHVFTTSFSSGYFAVTRSLPTASGLLPIQYDHISTYSQLYDCKQHYYSASSLELHLSEHRLWVCTARVLQRHDQSIVDTLTSKRNNHSADQLLEPKWHHHTNMFVKIPLVRNIDADQKCNHRVHESSWLHF